jgi:tripartite ATP-independent transporter DctP family solute receptor
MNIPEEVTMSLGARGVLRFAATWSVVIAVSCLIPATDAGAQQRVIRVGSSDPMTSPYMRAMEVFKSIVEKESGGTLQVRIYPSAQLGTQIAQIEGVMAGTQEINLATPAWFSSFFPAIDVLEMPFLVTDWAAVSRTFESDVAQELFRDAEKTTGVRISGWMPVGFRNMFNRVGPIEKLSDFAKMKVRLQNSAVHISTFRALGANPVALSYGEIYTGLQTGLIDAAEGPSGQILVNKFHEVGKYVTQTQHFFAAMLVYVNAKFYNQLSQQEKAIFDKAMATAKKAGYDYAKQAEDEAAANLGRQGAVVGVPSDALKKQMIEAVNPIYKEYGPKFDKYLPRLLKVSRG